MGFFSNLKCNMGFHNWTDWDTKKKENCTQKRRCINCSREDSDVFHEWSESNYSSIGNCQKNKKCHHCHQEEIVTGHIWEPWIYESPKSCNMLRNCSRCNSAQEHKTASYTDHQFGIPENIGPNLFLHTCKRCNIEIKNQIPK
jgi:hypothetical protein